MKSIEELEDELKIAKANVLKAESNLFKAKNKLIIAEKSLAIAKLENAINEIWINFESSSHSEKGEALQKISKLDKELKALNFKNKT